jgi:hypothetical protein
MSDSDSGNSSDDVAQQLTETMAMIKELQDTERDMYQTLIRSADNNLSGGGPVLTDTEKQDIITQINNLSATRVNLYQFIEQNYKNTAISVSESRNTLVDQTAMLQVLEDELNKSKTNLTALETDRDNQLRMVDINTYQSKSYDAQRRLMRSVAILGILLLLILVLGKISKKMSSVTNPLMLGVVVIGSVFTIRRVYDMAKRTPTNYDEYQWWWAPTSDTQIADSSGSFIDISGIDIPYVCAQQSCCSSGTTWSDSSGCVADTTDSFANYNPLKTCGQKTSAYEGQVKAYNQNFGVFDTF